MQHHYIKYADFDNKVLQTVSKQVYQLGKHCLPQVKLMHRGRFLDILRQCGNIDMANQIVGKGDKLPDKNFTRFSGHILAKNGITTTVV